MTTYPTTVYGFFYSDCLYESAPALQSLHRTKRAALKAMIAFQYEKWVACRDNTLPSMLGSSRKELDYQPLRHLHGYRVRTLELQA